MSPQRRSRKRTATRLAAAVLVTMVALPASTSATAPNIDNPVAQSALAKSAMVCMRKIFLGGCQRVDFCEWTAENKCEPKTKGTMGEGLCVPQSHAGYFYCKFLERWCVNNQDQHPFITKMKWVGKGCVPYGKLLPVDGGCQYDPSPLPYCSFQCAEPCVAQAGCEWSGTECRVIGAPTPAPPTLSPTTPAPTPPTPAPTTLAPTSSAPTTPSPTTLSPTSAAPTSAQPTPSPTNADPASLEGASTETNTVLYAATGGIGALLIILAFVALYVMIARNGRDRRYEERREMARLRRENAHARNQIAVYGGAYASPPRKSAYGNENRRRPSMDFEEALPDPVAPPPHFATHGGSSVRGSNLDVASHAGSHYAASHAGSAHYAASHAGSQYAPSRAGSQYVDDGSSYYGSHGPEPPPRSDHPDYYE